MFSGSRLRRVALVSSLAVTAAMSVAAWSSAASATLAADAPPGATDVWASVSAGILGEFFGHTCGTHLDGTLWCWGSNDYGELGVGDTVDRFRPVQVGTDSDWSVVSANGTGTCAVKTGGTMWCWGRDISETPTQVGSASNWTTVSVGGSFQCGLQSDSTLWCWGENGQGQLGQGDTVDRAAPTKVGKDWRSVSTLTGATCAVKVVGTLWCWGRNEAGSLGIGSHKQFVTRPQQVGSAADWRQVAGGLVFACGIREPGTLWCWGDNQLGELGQGDHGIGTERYRPAQVGTDTDWAMADAGDDHSCANKSDGTMWCWGANGSGQLGLGGGDTIVPTPHQLGSLTTWTGRSAGASDTCSLQTDHTLWCWGNSDHGKLGVGDRTKNTTVPVQVGLPNGPVPVSYSLESVSAVSPTDIWTVGTTQRKSVVKTFIEHGDGSTWSRVPSVDPGSRNSTLSAVSAVSATDAWAVGFYAAGGTAHPLIEHWDGSGWTQDALPDKYLLGGRLVAVDAQSATDVWAVGSVAHEFGYPDLLVLHWDGSSWTAVATDSQPAWAFREFTGVTVLGANDVWVSGDGLKDEEAGLLPLTEHWDGSAWTLVGVGFHERFDNHQLRAIDATSTGDLWTVGDQRVSPKETTLSEHWTGSAWAKAKTPNPGVGRGTFLYGVAAQASDDVWSVGTYDNGTSLHALVLRWTGSSWTRAAAPSPGGRFDTTLTSVSADASDDAWAVGFFDKGFQQRQVVEHWDGTQWTVAQKG